MSCSQFFNSSRRCSARAVGLLLSCVLIAPVQAQDTGTLVFRVLLDQNTAIPCRIHLKDSQGEPVRHTGYPFWHDHFVCDGEATLTVTPGIYSYEIERGPAFSRLEGTVEVRPGEMSDVKLRLDRIADLAREGWYSGDLHVHRPLEEIPLLMQAEDLDVAPVITWWNTRNSWERRGIPERTLVRLDGHRFFDVMAGEDERGGGALLYFHLDRPLAITTAEREHPSPLDFVQMAHRESDRVWIDIEKPFWWDVPTWVASGKIDSIGIANNHMCRRQMYEDEAWGRPRDEKRLPKPTGNGYWTQEIYYHLLNAGVRLPPSAGSASGVLPNPVGYNRVYVQLDGELDYDAWWSALKAGRSFVTNGPLLRCQANGQSPGQVFSLEHGADQRIEIDISLATLDRVEAIEIIENGKVVQLIKPVPKDSDAPWEFSAHATLEPSSSGWFLVRAIADEPRTFRFASTAPFYVEMGDEPTRISRTSVQFFTDWIIERKALLAAAIADERKLAEVLRHHDQALTYWRERLSRANAD